MVFIGLVSWWYSSGWLMCAQKMWGRTRATLGFFSVGQLARSLFAPFRQISAGRVDGPIGVQLRAWGDRLFSRMVGFVVRSLLILLGAVVGFAVATVGLFCCVIWPFIPIAPVIGLLIVGVGA